MKYIEKLELQTEEVKEVETLEKHSIINDTFSVNKYNGHSREFLPIGGEYDDGYKPVNETVEFGFSCNVAKEVNNLINKLGNIVYNVLDLGLVEGNKGNASNNTKLLQDIINKNGSVIFFFPKGKYKLETLELGTEKNVTFLGVSSTYATSVNKNAITGAYTRDGYSRIVVDMPDDSCFLHHTNCTVIVKNISMVNGYIDDNLNVTANHNNNFIRTTDSKLKGKVFTSECAFIGWKNVGGEDLKCCFMSTRTRFNDNIKAIVNPLDSRFIDCTFNKNETAIEIKDDNGISTIIGCRIEWNTKHGIYMDGGKDMTIIGNEFDCNGWSAIRCERSRKLNIYGNMLRRNGAKVENQLDINNNNHIYLNECNNVILTNNITVLKNTKDDGSGVMRPNYSFNINNCQWITVCNNDLRGVDIGDKDSAFLTTGNSNATIHSNMTYQVKAWVNEITGPTGQTAKAIIKKKENIVTIYVAITNNTNTAVDIPEMTIPSHFLPDKTYYTQRMILNSDTNEYHHVGLHVINQGTLRFSGNYTKDTSIMITYVL